MSERITITALPLAPSEYRQEYMNRLIKQINLSLSKLEAVGPITCGSDLTSQNAGYPVSGLTIVDVPTSSTNLPSGSVWSAGGVLKIINSEYSPDGLVIKNIPTSPTGLPSGSVWCDTTANNVLKIVS